MTQAEKRVYLIKRLLAEQPQYSDYAIPQSEYEQKRLLRSLMNVRAPKAVNAEFLKEQDEYLQAQIAEKGITDLSDLSPIADDIYLWQGDITALRCDAIVNAANSGLLGCFCPCHGCIDNAIHTYAGVQLRLECADIMSRQGSAEPTGKAKITKAYNLPCKYVIHTVGPIVDGGVTENDEEQLADCYRSCLENAEQNGINSIAFCCISTGEFHFPNERAAEIAIKTVNDYKQRTNSKIKVIFNVFKGLDYEIYRKLLG
ncbi:MAG: protein-ADP-ribose hydrolase [Acutalibacteraceae bacterium]|nr:protein-ADP-ribose hydrolase [Acutalibacteraceae bacterium]